MAWQAHPSVLPLLLGSGLLWLNALYLFRRHRTGPRSPGRLLAVGMVVCFAVSLGAFALEQAMVSEGTKVFWNKVQYIGDAPMLAFLFGYVLVYAGYTLSRKHYAALCAVPAVVLAGVFTNGFHHLYWTSVSVGEVQGYAVLENAAGPLFYLYIVFVYGLLLAALGVLTRTAFSSRAVHRRTLIALTVGTLVPAVAGIVYIMELGPTPTPNYPGYAYLVTAATFTYSVHRQDLFSIVPVARRAVTEGMDEGVITVDNRGIVVDANAAAIAALDIAESDIGTSSAAEVLGEIATSIDLENEEPQEATVELDERVLDVSVRRLVQSRATVGRVVVVRDVTDRHRRQEQLEAVTRRLELALAETDTGVWEWDLQTDAVFWDETSEALFGYEPGEFPETYEGVTDRVLDADLGDLESSMDDALETGDLFRAEFRIRRPDGTRRWIQSRGVVEFEGETPTRMVGVQTDVTERKRSERRLADQNRQLELLNRLIRHDIRNEATLLVERAGRLDAPAASAVERGWPDDDARVTLERIRESGERIADITDVAGDLTTAIAQSTDDAGAVPLEPMLRREVAKASTIEADATVRFETDVPDITVRGNDLLGSVFRNLLTNAIEHNEAGAPEVAVSVRLSEGQAHITVADNGPGIPAEQREAVLDEGVTLGDREGTGYGLWIVSSLTAQYEGRLDIEEASLGGTAVTVSLPIRVQDAETEEPVRS